MTAASPPKRAKSLKRLSRFFRGIRAAVSLPRIWLDSTPEAAARLSGAGKYSVCDRGSIPCGNAPTVPRRNRLLHLSKSWRAKFACLGYNKSLVVSVVRGDPGGLGKPLSISGDKQGRCRYRFHKC